LNILIVEARYHPAVTDALVDGATAALEKGGARFERFAVPGVLELPTAIAIAARSGRPFDGYIALGSVLRFSTVPEILYREAVRGLMELGIQGFAIGNGIVFENNEGSALDLATSHDVGGDAARACLTLLTFSQRQGMLR
jgi:6,7-dimethyl-8-ribityllumazine synthase